MTMPWQSLKNALLFNAFLCGLIAAVLIVDADAVAAVAATSAGSVPTGLMTAFGVMLAGLAMVLALLASRPVIPRRATLLLTGADAAFVAITPVIMVLAKSRLSDWGQLLLLDLALVTAFCVWCQWRGVRREGTPAA